LIDSFTLGKYLIEGTIPATHENPIRRHPVTRQVAASGRWRVAVGGGGERASVGGASAQTPPADEQEVPSAGRGRGGGGEEARRQR
jgi:hypothetical protein